MITLKVTEYANAWLLQFFTSNGRMYYQRTIYEGERPTEEIDYFVKEFYPAFGLRVDVIETQV